MIIIYLQITLENPNFYLTKKMVFLKITIFFFKKMFFNLVNLMGFDCNYLIS